MARILVIGASRGIGLATVKRALEAGHDVRAFARTANRIALMDARLEKIDGDALDRPAVERALQSCDCVVQSLGASVTFAKVDTFSRATRILVDAMTASGPRRLICVTGFGAGETRGRGGILYDYLFMPLVLKRIYDDKDVQERIVRDSSLDWTIVRPGYLNNGPLTGRVEAIDEPSRWRLGPISRADVAGYLVDAIADASTIRKTPVIVARA